MPHTKQPALAATPSDLNAPGNEHRAALVRDYLRRFGCGSLAYSTLQPDLEYFVHESLGYLAYIPMRHWFFAPGRLHCVIGDPVADPADFDALLDAYLQSPGAATTAFVGCNHDFAQVLHRRGYPVNELGVEWELPLAEFDFELRGKTYSHMRRWRNKASKEGVQVHEGQMSEVPPEELNALNAAWIQRKGGVEFSGLTRPMDHTNEEDVRVFWATSAAGRLLSLTKFDPMYRDGKVFGYYHNQCRNAIDAPHGTNDLIVLEAMQKFYNEGRTLVSLGISPFALIEKEEFPCPASIFHTFRFMFEHCQFIYPFKGNMFHKSHYRGRPRKAYVATIPGFNLYRMLAIFKAFHML